MEPTRPNDLLLERSQEYRSLYRRHQDLESRLMEYERRRFLHTRDELEARRMKKEKLALKDRMAALAQKLSPARNGPEGAGPLH